LYKAQRIYKRLGVDSPDDLYFKPKPKGMHQKTYDRLKERAEELDYESLLAIAKKYRHTG